LYVPKRGLEPLCLAALAPKKKVIIMITQIGKG
jgi:hypothetical protein